MNINCKKGCCRDCRHFHQDGHVAHSPEYLKAWAIGECRAHAPSPLTVPDGDEPKARTSWAVFPLVDEGINCGEFQPRGKEDKD